jgi:hypothetical protein
MKRTTLGSRPRSERLQWATLVISCAALFVALGVPSWAAGLIGAGQIKNDAVRSRHIKDNAVKSRDIADGKVSATDLAADSVGSEEIQSNAVGSDEIAANAVNSDEIATNAVKSDEIAVDAVDSPELEASSVSTSEVTNGSLVGDDVGRDSGSLNYDAPSIAANSCLFDSVNLGVGAKDFREDAIVATPDHSWPGGISVTPVGSTIIGNIQLVLCNHTAGAINPPAQPLNWITFNVG